MQTIAGFASSVAAARGPKVSSLSSTGHSKNTLTSAALGEHMSQDQFSHAQPQLVPTTSGSRSTFPTAARPNHQCRARPLSTRPAAARPSHQCIVLHTSAHPNHQCIALHTSAHPNHQCIVIHTSVHPNQHQCIALSAQPQLVGSCCC